MAFFILRLVFFIPRESGKRFPPAREWKGGAGMEGWGGNGKRADGDNSQNFHSGESRNLILAIARIFRDCGTSHCRLSAKADSPQRFPPAREWKGGAGMEVVVGNGIFFFTLHLDFFTLRRLRGGVRARSRSRGVERFLTFSAFRHPPKIRFANFYPPPQAAEGESMKYGGAGMGKGGGRRRG